MDILQIDTRTRVVMTGREFAAFAGLTRSDHPATQIVEIDPRHRCAAATNGYMAVAWVENYGHFPHRTPKERKATLHLPIADASRRFRVPARGLVVFEQRKGESDWHVAVLPKARPGFQTASLVRFDGQVPAPEPRAAPFDHVFHDRDDDPSRIFAPVLGLATLGPIVEFMVAISQHGKKHGPSLELRPGCGQQSPCHAMAADHRAGTWLFVAMPVGGVQSRSWAVRDVDMAAT